TGNTIVDALRYALGPGKRKTGIMSKYGLKKDSYMLLTLHRQENVDSREKLVKILAGIDRVCRRHRMKVIFPIHPRTVKMFRRFKIKLHDMVQVIEPCGFMDFLQLETNARLVLTDSGGVQEESCVLGVPCVTLRTTTERPETVDVGANVIAGTSTAAIARSADIMLNRKRNWKNPLGSGRAAEKIIEVLRKN
ncbi:MAG: UDP-N-acetylglucosamine 2-epimerase, partial [Candidatus Omnitrophota bacterium]